MGATAATSAACPATTNYTILPITGITIDMEDLLAAANLNCGSDGPDEVYKYAVIVNFNTTGTAPGVDQCGEEYFPDLKTFVAQPLVAAGIFDCFTDGTLGNLPLQDAGFLPDGGSQLYQVQIYLFNREAYGQYAASIQKAAQPYFEPAKGPEICQIPSVDHPAWSWATTCTAIEADDITVHAACSPLVTPAFVPMTDSGVDAANDGPPSDVTSERIPDATLDATEAATDVESQDATDAPFDAHD